LREAANLIGDDTVDFYDHARRTMIGTQVHILDDRRWRGMSDTAGQETGQPQHPIQ
jgi:hypothetical protein